MSTGFSPSVSASGASISWVNGRRLRVHGVILALCLWSVYGWNITAPGLSDRNRICSAVPAADFHRLRATGSSSLQHSPGYMVGRKRAGIRPLLLRAVAGVPTAAKRALDCAAAGDRVSRLFPLDGMGTDVGDCAGVLHGCVFLFAQWK